MLTIADTEATTPHSSTDTDENQKMDSMLLMSNKPLHRFLQKDPRCFGSAILIFGCAELMMGFVLAGDLGNSSTKFYIPFWQGALFLTCGILSIYTEFQPSKKTVTICLALYVVSILGILISIIIRMSFFSHFFYHYSEQRGIVEVILLLSSVCVSGMLIFLSTIARFALKSTNTQVVVRHVVLPPSN